MSEWCVGIARRSSLWQKRVAARSTIRRLWWQRTIALLAQVLAERTTALFRELAADALGPAACVELWQRATARTREASVTSYWSEGGSYLQVF